MIPFKVTVAIRKNHCKFDPISWIWQKTIPGMLDFWGGRIVWKTLGSCWKSGAWVARTFVVFWGSGKKKGRYSSCSSLWMPRKRKPTLRKCSKNAGKPAGYCPQKFPCTMHVVWQRVNQGIPPQEPAQKYSPWWNTFFVVHWFVIFWLHFPRNTAGKTRWFGTQLVNLI